MSSQNFGVFPGNDPKLVSLILNDPDDPPRFSVDEIEEMPESEVPESNPGFVLFDDDSL